MKPTTARIDNLLTEILNVGVDFINDNKLLNNAVSSTYSWTDDIVGVLIYNFETGKTTTRITLKLDNRQTKTILKCIKFNLKLEEVKNV